MERDEFQKGLGYVFKDKNLLLKALTHRSFANEQNEQTPYNERLEFLGDAVLDLAISDIMFRRWPDYDEGELTRLRAAIVNEKSLAEAARGLGLGQLLRLGRGELATGGRKKRSLLADAFEAIIGAVFLDGSYEEALAVIERFCETGLLPLATAGLDNDYKTRLQEITQNRFGIKPRYRVVSESGPDHDKRFVVEALIGDAARGSGEARSKKSAEQAAARAALASIEEDREKSDG